MVTLEYRSAVGTKQDDHCSPGLAFSMEIVLCCTRLPPKLVQVDFEAYVLIMTRPTFSATQQAELIQTQRSLHLDAFWSLV